MITWKDINENKDVEHCQSWDVVVLGWVRWEGGMDIKLVTAYRAKVQLNCDRCVFYRLGFELSFNMPANVSYFDHTWVGGRCVASLVYTGVTEC